MKLKVSLVTFLLLSLVLFIVPSIIGFDPERSRTGFEFEPPSQVNLMGTDALGRDLFARVLMGGRLSITIAYLVSLLSIVLGTSIGLYASFYNDLIGSILMRLLDVLLAIPYIFILITLSVLLREMGVASLENGTLLALIFGLTLVSWMTTARITYTLCAGLKSKQFVEAARSLGATNRRILFRHILPQLVGPLLIQLSLNINSTILAEAGVSFIGFGIHPRTPTWGNLLADSSAAVGRHWWIAIFPALTLLLFSINLGFLSDGLQEHFNRR